MNYSQRESLISKIGSVVLALNPKSEKWEKGTVVGTYHRERIGDFDIGLKINFEDGNGIQDINQKHVDA